MAYVIEGADSILLDLEQIVRYVAQDDFKAAQRLEEGIIEAVSQLSFFAKSGGIV